MFPDALREVEEMEIRSLSQADSTDVLTDAMSNTSSSNTTFYNTDPKLKDIIKSIHDAILAKHCELCLVDFNVFRWRVNDTFL